MLINISLSGLTSDTRSTLTKLMAARYAGVIAQSPPGLKLAELRNAVSAGEESVELDLTGWPRQDLSSLMRLADGLARETHSAPSIVLQRLAAGVLDADRQAHPGAVDLRNS